MKPKEPDQVHSAETGDRASHHEEYSQPESGRQQEHLLYAVDRIARASISANRLEEVLKLAVQQAVEVIGGATGIAWVHDLGPDRLRRVATFATASEAPPGLLDLATVLAERVTGERRASRTMLGTGTALQIASLCVPLIPRLR